MCKSDDQYLELYKYAYYGVNTYMCARMCVYCLVCKVSRLQCICVCQDPVARFCCMRSALKLRMRECMLKRIAGGLGPPPSAGSSGKKAAGARPTVQRREVLEHLRVREPGPTLTVPRTPRECYLGGCFLKNALALLIEAGETRDSLEV